MQSAFEIASSFDNLLTEGQRERNEHTHTHT